MDVDAQEARGVG